MRVLRARSCGPLGNLTVVALEVEDRFLLMKKKALQNKAGGEKEGARQKRMTQLRPKRHVDCVCFTALIWLASCFTRTLRAPERVGKVVGFTGDRDALIVWDDEFLGNVLVRWQERVRAERRQGVRG